jgi:glycosyltransferase involved in cell wall biosynthesis
MANVKALIYCPDSQGGIAEHANYQARAFDRFTKSVPTSQIILLCAEDFLQGRKTDYQKEAVFSSRLFLFSRFAGRIGELLDKSLKILWDQSRLAWEVMTRRPDVVLLSSYAEYLAPLWVLPHWILAKFFRVVYVANLHDPIRDYVVGPKWWHDLSVRMAYWPISVGVVHQRLPEPSPVPKHVHVVEAPVGVYDLQESPEDPEAIRAGWGVAGRNCEKLKKYSTTEDTTEHRGRCEMEQPKVGPKGARVGTIESKSTEGLQGNRQETSAGAAFSHHTTSKLARFASCHVSSTATSHSLLATPASPEVVFLAFGFIRDNKNLDLVIRALTEFPRAHLIVMGKAQSQKDKPVEFYRKLAEELALSERVKFFDTFVPDEKLASYFAAADVVVLTYDKSFHSQSGVLNVAARARRPVLASAGESPLKDCVEKFRLGVFVEPDDMRALKKGMASLINAKGGEPDWEGYEKFASWDVNVCKIIGAIQKNSVPTKIPFQVNA